MVELILNVRDMGKHSTKIIKSALKNTEGFEYIKQEPSTENIENCYNLVIIFVTNKLDVLLKSQCIVYIGYYPI